jgi:D-3-phosphoglycerate dehydrogenase
MKAYVRAPYNEACLEELKTLFSEVVYEPWTVTGERYYEDEMLEHLLKEKPDVLITELDRVTEKVLEGYDGLKAIGDDDAKRIASRFDAVLRTGKYHKPAQKTAAYGRAMAPQQQDTAVDSGDDELPF